MKLKWILEIAPEPIAKNKIRNWLLVIALVLSPWLLLVSLVGFILGMTYCTSKSLNRGNWMWTIHCSSLAGHVVSLTKPLTPLAFGLPVGEFLETVSNLHNTLDLADQVMYQLMPYEVALTNPSTSAPPSDTSNLTSLMSQLSEHLGYLQSQLLQTSRAWSVLVPFMPQVDAARLLVAKLYIITPQLPVLLSMSGQARWLILLQDNTELRPTGGYLDSVGLVKINRGHLTEARFLSSQVADSQLKGQTTSPVELQKLLGGTNWYLRDSNWDPDFPTTAARAAWFVSKELDQDPDAVMAINLSTLVQMLKVLGPVNLAEFGGQITTGNWLDNYLHTVKLESPDRFSAKLAEGLFNNIRNLNPEKTTRLMQMVITGLETRQIQIWPITFSASAITSAGWDGRLDPLRCSSPYPCLNDYIYQVDANVGINKVDPFVNRQVQVEVQIDSESTTTTYNMLYSHTGADSGWPQGEYKNYVRFYLPQEAEVGEIRIGGNLVSADKIDRSIDRGMTRLGLLISISPGKNEQIMVKWRQKHPIDPRWHYQLQIPNQSGVAPYPIQVRVNYPTGWWSQAGPAPAVVSAGRIGYNSLNSRPLRFNIDWVPSQ